MLDSAAPMPGRKPMPRPMPKERMMLGMLVRKSSLGMWKPVSLPLKEDLGPLLLWA